MEENERLQPHEEPQQPELYRPHTKAQRIVAWILAGIVLFAFLGTCYWLAFYR